MIAKNVGDVVKGGELEQYIVDVLAEKNAKNATLANVHSVLDAFKGVVNTLISQGAQVYLNGFVIFTPQYKPERSGMNALTNSPYTSPERASVTVRVGNVLKNSARKLTGEKLQELKFLKCKN